MHKAFSLAILSNMLEMDRVGLEGIPDTRDGIEHYGYFSFPSIVCYF